MSGMYHSPGLPGSSPHPCANRNSQLRNYNDINLEEMEKETEKELEYAKSMLKNTERQSRKGIDSEGTKPAKRPQSKQLASGAPYSKQNNITGKEAIKRLSKLSDRELPPEMRGKGALMKLTPVCARMLTAETNQLPKKPNLTSDEIHQLLEQEAKDVESAKILSNEVKENYKKPCPKQQKAREAVKAILETKREETLSYTPLIFKDPPPLSEPDPDDISPEVAANMMYAQERGIKMISCPEETVKHLFPEQFLEQDEKAADDSLPKEEEEVEGTKADEEISAEESEAVDDSVFTRNMSQKKESSQPEGGRKTFDKKEFVLREKASDRVNRVQMRGDYSPWFPGYFVAFPDQVATGVVQLAKSPSGIFHKAWMAAKPNNISHSDVYLVE